MSNVNDGATGSDSRPTDADQQPTEVISAAMEGVRRLLGALHLVDKDAVALNVVIGTGGKYIITPTLPPAHSGAPLRFLVSSQGVGDSFEQAVFMSYGRASADVSAEVRRLGRAVEECANMYSATLLKVSPDAGSPIGSGG